jgi:hypothetical protein
MGLEGSEQKMEVFDSAQWSMPQGPNPVLCVLDSCFTEDLRISEDPNCQMQLLEQVSEICS